MNNTEFFRKYADIIAEAEQPRPTLQHKHGVIDNAEGSMSPIHGDSFAPYDRKSDPRTWFRKDNKKD